jgi:hypothetical protein
MPFGAFLIFLCFFKSDLVTKRPNHHASKKNRLPACPAIPRHAQDNVPTTPKRRRRLLQCDLDTGTATVDDKMLTLTRLHLDHHTAKDRRYDPVNNTAKIS